MGVELAILQLLATSNLFDWPLNICAFLLSVGSSFCLLARPLLLRQVRLAGLGMTYREFLSRQQYALEMEIKDHMLAIGWGTMGLNLYKFLIM